MSAHYSSSYALPIPATTKGGHQYPTYGGYSVSPPEADESVSSGGPSYTAGGYSTTSSYAGSSHGDYESNYSASGVDFQDYMHNRFAETFNPTPLDRSMVQQAQASGKMNAKHRELLELQKQAQARLAKTRERFQEGLRDARDVHADLEWTQKKVKSLNTKASRKHGKEYSKARQRYPSPEY
jgi:hypothetical protein